MKIYEIIKALNGFVSPSGSEKKLLEFVRGEVSKYCDETRFDAMGNLICTMGKGCGEKVMFCAHSDTVGFIAHYIDENGYIRISPLGGLSYGTFSAQRVIFTNGVQGCVHYNADVKEKAKPEEYFVDIGADSREEAEALVPIGTSGSVAAECYVTQNGKKIVSAYLDNRISVAIQMEAMREIYESKIVPENELYFVFSVQEELGLRGAAPAAFAIEPKYAVAIDTTLCGDTPKNELALPMSCGKGACVKVQDRSIFCHPEMVRFLTRTAEAAKIAYQYELIPYGGTDAGAIHTTKSGVYTGAISLATRYVHTPTETVSLFDCEQAQKLIVETVKNGFLF